MSSFGCNCLTNVEEKGEKLRDMEEMRGFEMQNRLKSLALLPLHFVATDQASHLCERKC